MRIEANHPALPGHFPGHPVVPGVVLLDVVVNELARHTGRSVRITGFPAVKFLAPLGPDEEFSVTVSTKRPGQAAFELISDGSTLASGSVDFEAT